MFKAQNPTSQLNLRIGRMHPAGFTLIEVLVTVGIIVILTGLLLSGVLVARKKGFETRARSDLALIGMALEAYKDACGDYPRFSTPAEAQAAIALGYGSTDGRYPWLDQEPNRRALLLCRALIGLDNGPVAT